MLHIDIPTSADIELLAQTRDPASVSVYLPTSPVTTDAPGFRIEFKNLIRDAVTQLTEGGADKREIASIEEFAEELLEDEAFWAYLSHTLAVLLTPTEIRTFRLPNKLAGSVVEVSDRYYLKPLLRAVTFPQAAFVLALAQGSVRLIEVAEIEELTSAFASGRYGDFLARRATGSGPIRAHADKQKAADQVAQLNDLRQSATVGDVIDFVWSQGIFRKPRRVSSLEERIKLAEDPERAAKDQQFLDVLRAVPFSQVTSFERYLNDETPFSTNHGVKGEEYENVLVVLDDTLWTMYKFEAVLAGDASKNQFERTLNLFYVSCSRAMENLVILAVSPLSSDAIAGAKRMFGESNYNELS